MLKALKKSQPDVEIKFWCDKKFYKQAGSIMRDFDPSIRVEKITSGKFRRYHHLTWWQHLLIPSVVFPNSADGFKVLFGVIQAFFKLLIWRPDVIFLKGGFVCLPVGWAATALKIPYVIHDSDAHPGLTNRLLAKHAAQIATGAPLKYYHYPKNKAHYVGIPVSDEFRVISDQQKRKIKKQLGFKPDLPLVTITGGGLGAKRINDETVRSRYKLSKHVSVLLISGMLQYDELKQIVDSAESAPNFQLQSFVSKGMADIINASDLVVARAGATSIVELVAAQKPTILVPNARLTGGHQVKNSKVYADADAVEIADEEKFSADKFLLADQIIKLVDNPKRLAELSKNIKQFSKPKAAEDVAKLVVMASSLDK